MPMFRHARLYFISPHKGLFSTQRKALESDYSKILAGLFQILGNGKFRISDKFLVHQTVLLVELSHTTVGDILDHLFGKIGRLLLCSLFLQRADGFCIGLRNVSFADSFFPQYKRCIRPS